MRAFFVLIVVILSGYFLTVMRIKDSPPHLTSEQVETVERVLENIAPCIDSPLARLITVRRQVLFVKEHLEYVSNSQGTDIVRPNEAIVIDYTLFSIPIAGYYIDELAGECVALPFFINDSRSRNKKSTVIPLRKMNDIDTGAESGGS